MTIGERIGDYEIIEVLGSGGMGKVYKVRNVLSERIEAMKVLLPSLGGDADMFSRFLREIKVQAALDHPHIARLHTSQMVGRELIMAMEYVDGTSLEKLLAQGPLGWRETVDYAEQALDALAYAHSHDVIHRDIKPANIMLTPAGIIKLMDFGIARLKTDYRLTQTGRVVGSLFYMSPEQIKGGEPDARSDIYSFGITVYELVTGRRPFQGDSDYSLMAAHLQQIPAAPIEIVPGFPTELNEIILKAIAKDPAGRFQTAGALRDALQGLRTSVLHSPTQTLSEAGLQPSSQPEPLTPAAPPITTAPPSEPSSRRGLYMALGSVATLVVLAAAAVEGPKFFHVWASRAVVQRSAPAGTSAPTFPNPAALPADPPPSPAQAPTPDQTRLDAHSRQAASAPLQQERSRPQQQGPPPVAAQQPPSPPVQVQSQQSPQVPKDLRDRLANLQARTAAMDVTLESLRSPGLALRPALAVAQNMAHVKLAQANQEMAEGRYMDAGESLDTAESALQEIEKIYRR
jgi:serine/threonine protein kinase